MSPRRTPPSRKMLIWFGLLGLSLGAVPIGGAVDKLVTVHHGRSAVATVDRCSTIGLAHSVAYNCSGSWVARGAGPGSVVVGDIDGADPSDVGHRISVRVVGGAAYVRSTSSAIALLVLGGILAAMGVLNLVRAVPGGARPSTRRTSGRGPSAE